MTPELRLRLHQMRLHQRVKSVGSYRSALRAGVRGLWNGELDLLLFGDQFDSAINRYFTEAWVAGMAEAGLSKEDMNADEQRALADMIFAEEGYVSGFGQDILAESKAAGFPLEPHFQRVEMWVKRYANVKNQALQLARTDPVLEWVTHAAESCTSCLKLNGQRRRSSTWAKVDLRPQHPKLECMRSAGGVDVCKCTFNVTDQSPTRGRLPKV